MNGQNNKKQMKLYKGGYLPVDKIGADIQIHKLLENPPILDPSNKAQISAWLKKIYSLFKS